ncbi:MAG: hypothetical protein H8D96_16070 [Desulfobacterales bacterium]|uniref:OmpH family outer membrane protein n=1 Tax=Candidatus Desulfatibia vada TaxID=2841696 RepID=A0A8J6NT89_9BACT|nr:hypothetical protein [Candidatus Desulfatibia vada]
MKKLILTFLILSLSPLLSGADTVILKNGMRFESDKIWQEGNEIKCYRSGIVIGFSKDDVERIVKTPSEAAEITVPAAEQMTDYDADKNKSKNEQKETVETAPAAAAKSPEFNFDEIKKRFERIQKELDLAYQTMLKEFEQLERDKKRLKPVTATIKYNERVLRYHQNLKDYERKRKDFNNEVQVYKIRAEKESDKRLFDDENFATLLKGWLNSPVDAFIDLWGYPDEIIKISDGNRQYLFVIEVTPSFTRKILFLTNPAGKIIELRTDVEKISNASQ